MTIATLRRFIPAAALACALGATALSAQVAPIAAPFAAGPIPTKLTDAEYWKMITDFSEESGYFQSENFTSNETSFQTVIPELLRTTKPGGIYLGVGPEQNFTYIANLKPAMVFIVDIRRQNMLQHLIYKALFELYPTRADFISRLFSRPRPAGLDSTSTVDALFTAMTIATPDSTMSRSTFAAIVERLTKTHGFTLSTEDIAAIRRVFDVFYLAGPELNYAFTPENGFNMALSARGRYPSFAELMGQHDGTGLNRNFLATEANYRFLRDIETRNMLVPVVGNFGGNKALKLVGDYLRAKHATVTAMYCSNVEQYLFMDGIFGNFYTNVGNLPLDSTSTFIRSIANQRNIGYKTFSPPNTGFVTSTAGMHLPQVLASMMETVKAFKAGLINEYGDVINLSHQ